ncbi:MAG TPA: MarR family transcriptional regulator [Longimicrobium sp.]|nr:MarR family transcriptional regulator [Longimicrobium sp.]
MALHNLWHLFNLRESPYFQQDLQASGAARYPIDLFVGRDQEAARLINVIAGSSSSRQTIEGLPGFGKTTLAQRVKAEAAPAGYVSYPVPVSAAGTDTPDALLVRLLSYVYEALASQVGHAVLADPLLETARRLVRDTRVKDVKVAAQVAGFGLEGEVTRRTETASFHSALLAVPPLLRDLARVAQKHGIRGVIVHLNNLENLVSDRERSTAGAVLRDLRDIFLFEGYHYLLVGTPEAVRAIVSPHAQLRSVFGLGRALEPLPGDSFQALLSRRYSFLRLEKGREVNAPISHDAARELYRQFRGDLRGTLRALDAAAHELIGYTDPPGAPIQLSALMEVVVPMLQTEADAVLSGTLLDYFYALRELGDRLFTQAELMQLWGLSQGTVSQNVNELQRLGYLQEYRREGRRVWYGFTGTSRLVLQVGSGGGGDLPALADRAG